MRYHGILWRIRSHMPRSWSGIALTTLGLLFFVMAAGAAVLVVYLVIHLGDNDSSFLSGSPGLAKGIGIVFFSIIAILGFFVGRALAWDAIRSGSRALRGKARPGSEDPRP